MERLRRRVVIEVSRGSFIKRKPDGSFDFVSPLPAPFNYGSVPDTLSEDGDPLDAVVLGRWLPRGAHTEGTELGVVDFVDAGDADPKLIIGEGRLSLKDRLRVVGFFRAYAILKTAFNRARGKTGLTAYRGLRIH